MTVRVDRLDYEGWVTDGSGCTYGPKFTIKTVTLKKILVMESERVDIFTPITVINVMSH